ncbi:MAG: nucleoside triphosphate pyrophosphohydrolase [Bacteroidetes bacterium]|nr:nucleoside triphosphate pyrophosphohydrolase [Bacteroidota bacterium]
MKKDSRLAAFKELLDIMDELREKCPWDRKQTFESLRKLTIEETYELADAILKKNPAEIKDELGDLMLHIAFYAKLGSENGTFNMTDILNSINKKLITRHPHVFGNTKVADEEEVMENWEKIKLRNGKKSVLDGIPKSLPSLIKANRLQEKVHGVGFDWEDRSEIWEKINEEIGEVREELLKLSEKEIKEYGGKEKLEEEIGDLLFSIINAARLYGIDPENSLERTNNKFKYRFQQMEMIIKQQGKKLEYLSLDEMNRIWEEVKKDEEIKG